MTEASLDVSPDHITKEAIDAWVTKYPSILPRVYATKNAKLTAREALEEDKWRYNTLPELLENGNGMTKQQLARLVKWKITHGVYRPFLPGMIQKNADADVVKHTSRAAAILQAAHNNSDDAEAYKTVEAALKEVTNLTGVGPATGTLVLSIYEPGRVPFFADELFAWVVPGHAAKLKYDRKEYAMLWKGVRAVQRRMGMVGLGAHELEKAAYAVQHMDVLGEGDRVEKLGDLAGPFVVEEVVKEDEEGKGHVHVASERAEDAEKSQKGVNGESKGRKPKRKRRTQKADNGSRRSKRVKR